MPDPFFSSAKHKKRKLRPDTTHKPRKRISKRDEELDSAATDDDAGNIDDLDLAHSEPDENESGDEYTNETPAEKRLRLAQIYLDSVKKGLAGGEYDAADIDRDLIGARLKQDVLEHSGKIHLRLADLLPPSEPAFLRTKGHRLPITCTTVSEDGAFLFTASKEGSIIQWNITTGQQIALFPKIRSSSEKGKGKAKAGAAEEIRGHTDEIWSLAISSDGKYLASGGKDKKVIIWDLPDMKWRHTFAGHKDSVSALAFRKGTHQLYSASYDRTLKLWDLAVMGYVETLFGHQDVVTSLDALRAETALSSGARDKTVRFWKIVDESQLVFRGGGRSKIRDVLEGAMDAMDEDAEQQQQQPREAARYMEGSIDCVAMLDESTFVSGGDSGSICLWSTAKKKPLFTEAIAHGLDEKHSSTEGLILIPRWITSLAALRYSDLFASGSWDGLIRLWKVDSSARSFSPVRAIPAPGFINSLQFIHPLTTALGGASWTGARSSESGSGSRENERDIVLVAGTSQEPRLGRWMRLKGDGVRNGALVLALTRTAPP
ncbi:hypothetical protein BOTBODRAFT_112892 [Botryobasidium botryosum FD-172 SS1]|uniref:Uncharacterized protein n=1 Tax=Botryobasidium botryosum (strain FD-172 SS1) TaxID=930990 RepID=A0A067MKM9_BOTB1|nr:hypothetical protein BOTBODRAFT_112892 [Botryobasidium botryosum FD-172 SS1]